MAEIGDERFRAMIRFPAVIIRIIDSIVIQSKCERARIQRCSSLVDTNLLVSFGMNVFRS